MNYERIKKYIKENQLVVRAVAVSAIMFVAGFGTGQKFSSQPVDTRPKHPNSTTNSATRQTSSVFLEPKVEQKPVNGPVNPSPTPLAGTSQALPANASAGQPASNPPDPPNKTPKPTNPPTTPNECLIKGNISGKNRIYHVEGGAFYERTTPEQCFATEAEAEAAGFRKSAR